MALDDLAVRSQDEDVVSGGGGSGERARQDGGDGRYRREAHMSDARFNPPGALQLPLHMRADLLRRPIALLLAMFLAAASVIALTACGEDDNDSDVAAVKASATRQNPVDTLLASTFSTRAPAARSGRVDLALKVGGEGVGALKGPISVRMRGPFDFTRQGEVPRFDVATVVDVGGRTVRSGAVSTGRAGYVHLHGTDYELPPELWGVLRQALAGAEIRGATPALQSMGVDPRRWLQDPVRQEAGEVDGVAAKHVHGTLNVPRMLDDLDTMIESAAKMGLVPGSSFGLSAEHRQRVERAVRTATVDMWVGQDDHILRRLDVDVALEDRGTLRLRLGVADVNHRQTVAAPREARPFADLLSGGLQKLVQTVSDPDEKGAAGRMTRGVADCLQRATSSPEALQACALSVLGGPPTRGSP